jgi:hypothetical protein
MFGLDWVQLLPVGFRAGVLIVLLAGLLAVVAVKVVLRLVRDFRAGALALVLERRFPSLLGDRLITAVEMADPRLARRYGFSQAMIDRTVQEAAERVDQLPIGEVFNWGRLGRYAIAVGVLSVGVYLLVAAGYFVQAAWHGQPASLPRLWHGSKDVAAIWFERNVLLWNTIWPRRAHLELVGFPESGEMRLGRNVASTPLRVRAIRWIVADPQAHEGWRALYWSDLADLGISAPDLPADWREALSEPAGIRVDRVEWRFANDEARQALDADHRFAIDTVFEQLDELARDPSQGRTLRKLEVPETVMVRYWGAKKDSEMSLKKGNEHEFSGVLSDLTESVRFHAWAEDYVTRPPRQITLVPPPSLMELYRDEDRPAYLYHRPPRDGSLDDLKGLKQQVRRQPVSLTGETSRIDLPAGTDIRLVAVSDKDLVPGGIRLLPRMVKGKPADPAAAELLARTPIELQADRRTFVIAFANVTRLLDFDLEFRDDDHVIGRRHLMIRPSDDVPPEVDVLVETIRKTAQGYMVSPIAMIPFSGKVRDDHGLDRLEYVYSYSRLDAAAVQQAKALLVGGMAQFLPSLPTTSPLVAPLYLSVLARVIDPASEDDASLDRVPLVSFQQAVQRRASADVPLGVLKQRLAELPPRQLLLRDHSLDPKVEFFDLQRLLPHLLVTDTVRQTQPRYRMRLTVVAHDNNVETGPGVGQGKERFTFVIVSETELLAEIAKEEENLHVKMEDTVSRLRDAKFKLDEVGLLLKSGLAEDQLRPQALRAQEIEDTIVKSLDITREVYTDYSRILNELIVNRVQPGWITRVGDKICKPLDGALNGEFVRAEEAQRDFRRGLEARKPDTKALLLAQTRLQELIDHLGLVLDQMGEITTLNRLIVTLRALEDEQGKQSERLKEIRDRVEEILIGSVLDRPPSKKP